MANTRPSAPRRAGYLMLVAISTAALTSGSWSLPAAGSGHDPLPLGSVKLSLGCWESGGNYTRENTVSGAYGKYQILPGNWPAWARKYLGSSRAAPTAANQEQVASGKLLGLRTWLVDWQRVLYWWLTGDTERDRSAWSTTAKRYVGGIMSMAERSGTAAGRRTIPKSCFSTPSADPTEPPDTGPAGGGSNGAKRTVAVSILNIRTGPGTTYRVVGGLLGGDEVTVLERAQDSTGRWWLRVSHKGDATGWIAKWWTRATDTMP